jgi:hypothetical protein
LAELGSFWLIPVDFLGELGTFLAELGSFFVEVGSFWLIPVHFG